MPTKTEILAELKQLSDESTRKTHQRHGAVEPFFGVKVANLKTIQKRIKHDHKLALQLFDTGNADAQYLASFICEPAKFTPADLRRWAATANWHMISEYSVAWAAAESPHGWELGNEWIQSSDPKIVATGWATLGSFVSVTPNDQIETVAVKKLIKGIPKAIKHAPARVAYTMNNFLICVGSYIEALTDVAMDVGDKLGRVEIDLGDNCCKVPYAPEYITKVIQAGRVGKKRKTAYC